MAAAMDQYTRAKFDSLCSFLTEPSNKAYEAIKTVSSSDKSVVKTEVAEAELVQFLHEEPPEPRDEDNDQLRLVAIPVQRKIDTMKLSITREVFDKIVSACHFDHSLLLSFAAGDIGFQSSDDSGYLGTRSFALIWTQYQFPAWEALYLPYAEDKEPKHKSATKEGGAVAGLLSTLGRYLDKEMVKLTLAVIGAIFEWEEIKITSNEVSQYIQAFGDSDGFNAIDNSHSSDIAAKFVKHHLALDSCLKRLQLLEDIVASLVEPAPDWVTRIPYESLGGMSATLSALNTKVKCEKGQLLIDRGTYDRLSPLILSQVTAATIDTLYSPRKFAEMEALGPY